MNLKSNSHRIWTAFPKVILALLASITLSACGGVEAGAKKAVLDSLKDPGSAKMGKFTLINERNACLTVNARNSMGGYTGDQQASLSQLSDSTWQVISIDALSHEDCIEIMKGLAASKQK